MSKHFNRTALALIAAGLAAACGHDEPKPVTRETVSAPTEIVQPAPLAATRTIAGTVRSANVSPLAAKVMGNVVRVHVAEGDRVKAGQLLVEIDARESVAQANAASSSIAAAEANSALAEATFRRFDALRARGSVSAQEFDNVKAQRDAAQAELARARAMSAQASAFLDYASVRAPMDGVVAQRFVDPGAQAAPGMPLLTIEDTRSYRIEALVPEDVIARAGDTVRIEIGGESIEAQITRVQPGVDPVTRSSLVQIALAGTAVSSRAGTAGSAG
ncbi:MAG TPA: efflux RND transporter periplasmic adaptor subunit, partial [Thermoanaerobaculia bacterium]|nr:efflux RND transporter periplasmic adaptor subunit [Thermoanaerobaculia bacterium]